MIVSYEEETQKTRSELAQDFHQRLPTIAAAAAANTNTQTTPIERVPLDQTQVARRRRNESSGQSCLNSSQIRNSHFRHQTRARNSVSLRMRPRATQTTILLASFFVFQLLASFHHIPMTSGLLLDTPNAPDQTPQSSAASSQTQTQLQQPQQPQPQSNSSPGFVATIIDSAAKAAISSLSSIPSAEPSAKSLGASSATSSVQAASKAATSAPSSIVASLSSAVASAAVASAVAAARNSLAPSTFGSSSSSSSSKSNRLNGKSSNKLSQSRSSAPNSVSEAAKSQNQNSPLNHIAMRLADAIPEVPYNILHNMKKLDHAAPFYNVDSSPVSKASGSQASLAAAAAGGIRKESSPLSAALSSLLTSAISAASGPSASSEQIGALFRTPLWRRLADGYGDFAAEFRSFFKPNQAASVAVGAPSKALGQIGSLGQLPNLGSMSHLMRELSVSVPVVMYLANKAIKSDWRPTRTNRKSFMQNILGTQASSSMSPLDSSLGASSPSAAVSASPIAGNFLGSLQAISPLEPMQMSADSSPSAAQLVGNQLLNAMQQQHQHQQPQSNFFLQSPLMQAAQDVLQQQQQNHQQRIGSGFSRRSADLQQQKADHHRVNLNLNDNNQDHLGQLASVAAEPVSQAADGPVTLFAGDQLEGRSSNGAANWITLRAQSSAQAKSSSSSETLGVARSAKSVSQLISKSSKFLQDLLQNANRQSTQQATSKRRHDETKLIALNDKHRYSLIADELDSSGSKLSPAQNSLLSAVSHIIGLNSSPKQEAQGSSESGLLNKKISHQLELLPQAQAQTSSSSQQTSTVSGQPEQRDLSHLLPQTWKEAVKRTYNNVQHSASNQWRSIEGQITGWLKPAAAAAPAYHLAGSTPTSNAHNHFHTATSGPAAGPVTGFLQSAVNMLGLGAKQQVASAQTQPAGSSTQTVAAATGPSASAPSDVSSSKQPAAKQGGLAAVASIILNSITGSKGTQQTGQNNPVNSPSTASGNSSSSKTPSAAVSVAPPPAA